MLWLFQRWEMERLHGSFATEIRQADERGDVSVRARVREHATSRQGQGIGFAHQPGVAGFCHELSVLAGWKVCFVDAKCRIAGAERWAALEKPDGSVWVVTTSSRSEGAVVGTASRLAVGLRPLHLEQRPFETASVAGPNGRLMPVGVSTPVGHQRRQPLPCSHPGPIAVVEKEPAPRVRDRERGVRRFHCTRWAACRPPYIGCTRCRWLAALSP
jgi:hypothetical protein